MDRITGRLGHVGDEPHDLASVGVTVIGDPAIPPRQQTGLLIGAPVRERRLDQGIGIDFGARNDLMRPHLHLFQDVVGVAGVGELAAERHAVVARVEECADEVGDAVRI
ncbi:hypothetical protein D3C85_1697230 [compost metagenome]